MAADGESFADLCWPFTDEKQIHASGREWITNSPLSEKISEEMKCRGFKFIGPMIVYTWMQAIDINNDHGVDSVRRSEASTNGRP